MIYHELLKRQLKRNNISETVLPKNIEDWKTFLTIISKTYSENDQDRYVIERSLEVSSKEMQELYDAFDESQKIAHMGSWVYNVKSDKNIWSNEMYQLCNRDTALGPPSYNEFLSYIHPNDISILETALKKIYHDEQDLSIEFRIMTNGQERWMRVECRVSTREDSGYVEVIAGTMTDITEKKLIDKKLSVLNDELMTAARRAGMAEVASSVLHNIGNVLNSLNVTASILLEKLVNGKINNIKKLSELINEHRENLGEFIKHDPKGKYIPEYLSSLAENWNNEQKNYVQYLTAMNEHIQHIKDIVSRQQSLSGSFGIIQPVMLSEIINDALSIAMPENEKFNVELKKEFMPLPNILIDKSVLLQILVNLIRNAIESLNESKKENKQLLIKLFLMDSTTVSISVEDNGTGILPENINKIFSHAFTTKPKGSGIGLHTSLLAARGMGGNLQVFNLGKNKGAIFVINFPYKTV